MAHWLVKSEPASYGWDDLVEEGRTEWTGVRNHAAALNLKAMRQGDEAFFYHSMTGLEIVGVARITREAAPDPTRKDGNWVSVELAPVCPLATPVTLKQIKADVRFKDMALVRLSRLSVGPVTDEEWAAVLELSAG